jgi:hypothetical protein
MTTAENPNVFVRLLSRLSAGSIRVDIDSVPFATLDARARTLDVQVGPLLHEGHRGRSTSQRRTSFGLWNARRVPGELAREGWRVTLHDGDNELVALGRGTSALTGHVHVSPVGLWKLRKLV